MDPKDRISVAELTTELQKLPRMGFAAPVPRPTSTGPSTALDPDFAQISAPRSPLPSTSTTSQLNLPSDSSSGFEPSAEIVAAIASPEMSPALGNSPSEPRPSSAVNCARPATLPLYHDCSAMLPTQALAAFRSVFTDETAAAVACRDDIEFAIQLSSDFAAKEGKNYDISRPLYEALSSLKKVLASSAFAIDYKGQISMALPEAVAVVKNSSGFRDELVRSDELQVRQMEEKEEHALQQRDIPQAEQYRKQILQFQSAAAQRLKECDQSFASLSKLTSEAENLLARQPTWPCHGALIRFEENLLRLTSHLFFSKKWVPRFFVLRGNLLYYSNGKKGYPDSLEGSLQYMNSKPRVDEHFCMDIAGTEAICIMSLFCVHISLTFEQAEVLPVVSIKISDSHSA